MVGLPRVELTSSNVLSEGPWAATQDQEVAQRPRGPGGWDLKQWGRV